MIPDRLPHGSTRLPMLAAWILLLPSSAFGALDWSLDASAVEASGVRIDGLRVGAAPDGRVELRIEGIELPAFGRWGGLVVDCPAGPARCVDGSVARIDPAGGTRVAAGFRRSADGLRLVDGESRLSLQTSREPMLEATQWPLAGWLDTDDAPVALQGGRIDATLAAVAAGFRAEWTVSGLAFDTTDGRYAAGDVDLSGRLERSSDEIDLSLTWRAGEALFGPVYVPPPVDPLRIEARLSPASEDRYELVYRVRTGPDDGGPESGDSVGRIRVSGAARLAGVPSAPRPIEVRAEIETLDLGRAWTLGLESIAARAGWPGLVVDGAVDGSLDWRSGRPLAADLAWREVRVEDPSGRIGVEGLRGALAIGSTADAANGSPPRLERIDVAFERATVYRLPLGAAAWALVERDAGLTLLEPLRLPVLDGAVRIDRLVIDRSVPDAPAVDLDAAIEPLDLASLTDRLGLPRFGGSLSGRIPGVRLDGGTLRVDGGLDLELFSGQARIRGLSIERPFGTLPALSASVEFERLDLAQLTSAFEFGAMRGELEGYVRGLRLLDWEPVAFDAWLHAPADTDKRRRISQRAVDQIASLGGGARALSAPLLGLFEDFAYQRIGLGCRLAANVCRMRGLDEIDGGGYRIVAGRGIPHLDVVGYRREVDWPVLLRQLRAATQGEGVRVGD